MTEPIEIEPVFLAYGGRVRSGWSMAGWSAAYCCLHDDSRASAQINTTTNRFRCLTGCGNHDAISLVMAKEGLRFRGAKKRAEELAGGSDPAVRAEPRREGSLLPQRTGDRRERRAYKPPWLVRRPGGRA